MKRKMLQCANEMHTNLGRKCRKTGAAAAFVDACLETGRVSFALGEIESKTGLSRTAVKDQLRRLGGRVVRISRHQSFFVIVEPRHRPTGAPPVEWWLDAYFRWLGHPYYLALQSAAEIYNSAPQAILVKQVMTDVPRRDVAVGRLRIRFFVKRRVEGTPVEQPPNAYAPLRVSTREATALDLIRYVSRTGGIGRATEMIMPLLPRFRTTALRNALNAEDTPAVAQRLGYLIETAGHKRLAQMIHQWLPSGIVRVPLERSGHALAETPESRRWRLLVPAHGGQP